MALIFLSCERTRDSTEVQASIYDRKAAARHLDTIQETSVQSLLKGRNVLILCQRGATHLRLSGTRVLNIINYAVYILAVFW